MTSVDLRAAWRSRPADQSGAIEVRGRPYANPPGQARLPSRIAKVSGDRGEPVQFVRPDVRKAVAVAIRAKAEHDRRHELGIAGGPCPAALKSPARDALVHQLEGRDELVLEEIAATSVIAQ